MSASPIAGSTHVPTRGKRGSVSLADAAAILAIHGIDDLDKAALPDLIALAEVYGWRATTERLPLAKPTGRCRALLVQAPPGGAIAPHGTCAARASGPTEAAALGKALASLLGRGAEVRR